jgi:hypothetical protein
LKLKHLKELNKTLEKLNLTKQEVCIVGSGVMAALDLRENKDLDIIILHEKRKHIAPSNKNFSISKNVECVSVNWLKNYNAELSDDRIINDSTLHFMKFDFKFCNLELLKQKKQFSMRTKDKEDLRLINDRS